MLNIKDIIPLLDSNSEKVKIFENGDLMTVNDIKNNYQAMEKLLSDTALKDIFRYVRLVSTLVLKLSLVDNDKEIREILLETNENLKNLFSKKIRGQKFADKTNELIKRIQAILKNIDQRSVQLYSNAFFDNIVDDKKMLSQLCEEVKEHLNTAQYTLIELEYDDSNQENINKVFRSFHTIKGSSAFLGLKNIEEVAHEMENMLVLIRDRKLRVSKELIDVIFFGIELLRSLITITETNEFHIKKMAESFKKINIFNYINLIKKIITQYQFKKIGEILEEEGKISEIDIKSILNKQAKANKKFGEIAVEEKMITHNDLDDAIQKQQSKAAKKTNYVKVSNDRLNSLVDIVGELVINQSMLRQIIQNKTAVGEGSERTVSQLESITTNIKNLVLSMGMVPIAEVFNKLRVVVRNTSRDLNKAVIVETKGEETELDRNVIESIYDPLVHMVRNSIDHGIEFPEEREADKKDRMGKIIISAENKGSGIEITVFDDGKGIDKEQIINKAVGQGLIDAEKAGSLTEKELYGFMFLPGFSTASKVTEVSGRGVGLDVVKKNVEEIHGRVEIFSKKGQYTRFVIKLPLTLAIIEGFVTVIGANKYILPFNAIDEIIVPKKENVNTLDDGSVMLFNRGSYIPIIFAHKIFHEIAFNTELDQILIIVITYDNKNYGIAVDKVVGKQEIVIKNLGEALSSLTVFSGGTIFGDGTIGFVVDIEGFLEEVRK